MLMTPPSASRTPPLRGLREGEEDFSQACISSAIGPVRNVIGQLVGTKVTATP